MEVKVIKEDLDDLTKTSLDNFTYKSINNNFFQSQKIFKFYSLIKNYHPILILAIEKEIIRGYLLAVFQKENGFVKGNLSKRCIIYGGPSLKDSDTEVIDQLLTRLVKEARSKSNYIEFRNLFDLSNYKEVFKKNGFDYKEHFNIVVELFNPEENFRRLSENRRRQIKKSLKEGAQIVKPENLEDVKSFFSILKTLYIEKVKKPLPGFDFFKRFYELENLGKYFIVKYQEKVIGGIMCPVYKDTIYEWYICGLDSQYKNVYPSVLATWASIEYGSSNGLEYFDFLGAGEPNKDYGVREFKSKFGGELVNYGRFIRINDKLLYNIGRFGLLVYSKLR